MLARDLMNKKPVTARPDMTCEEVQELLVLNKISGAPVIDDEERLVGVISMSDVLATGMNLMYAPDFVESSRLDRVLEAEGFHLESVSEGFVSDFMSRNVITAYPDTTAEDMARIMVNKRIHRLIIVHPKDQSVLGIVSTFDLLLAVFENRQCQGKCPQELLNA